jgi:hypothetical protein
MSAECGICEYPGDLASAPLFICLNCADAIRRWFGSETVSSGRRKHRSPY